MPNVIAEKLREAYHNDLTDVPLLIDAAEEIARLEAALAKAREDALEEAEQWHCEQADLVQHPLEAYVHREGAKHFSALKDKQP